MFAKLFGFLLFACLIILNSSYIVSDEGPVEEIENPTAARPYTRPDGYVAFPNVNVAYKIFEENTTWYDARDRCIEEGANLAITDSYDKVRLIFDLRNQTSYWLHVGIYKSKNTGQWVRVNNDLSVESVPWISDNPTGTGNCSGISLIEVGLVDYPCDSGNDHFVCEKPLEGPNLNYTLPQNQTRILPEGYVAHSDIGTAYKIYTDEVTWEVARARCLAEGAHLAVTDTNLKLAFLIHQTPFNVWGIHVGIHRMDNNTEWVSATDGSTLSNLPWKHSEPDETPSHDAVYAWKPDRGLATCKHTDVTYFACEIPITPN